KLVIGESRSKARTIAGYLGQGYVVESSVGHIRDMPDSAADIPAKYKGEPWARLGVNVDDNFQALYVVHSDKRQQVSKLKSLLKDADELLLATDEDREGEAIAWHLLEELKPKVPTSRMVFHEITPEAIARAIANPRQVDDGLVDAYQARRVLDRLYGYEVSPVLWKQVMPKLSAGRVQSVAPRRVCPARGKRRLRRGQRGTQAVPALALRAVPHHHAAAGGLPPAELLGQAHDVGRAAPVRERLHHLYAHGLGDAIPDRDQRGPQ